jgi:hypothetical protein
MRVSPDAMVVGAGAHGFDNRQLAAYRDAVIKPTAGPALATIVTDLEAAGHEIGGETYKRIPRGYAGHGISERLLRHSALYAHSELPSKSATSTRFVETALGCWRTFIGVHRWLVANVQK